MNQDQHSTNCPTCERPLRGMGEEIPPHPTRHICWQSLDVLCLQQGVSLWKERYVWLEKQATRQAEEVLRLRDQVADLQSKMFINCVYCGHRYGPSASMSPTIAGATSTVAEMLRAHIATCPKHPASLLRAALEEIIKTRTDSDDVAIATRALQAAGMVSP